MDKHLQEVLEALPDSLQELIKPKLEAANQHFITQIEETNEALKAYEPFKIYLDNKIDPEYVEQSVRLADELQREPNKVIGQINEAWNLGFMTKEEAEKQFKANDDGWGSDDLEENPSVDPRYAELEKKLEELQGKWDEQQNHQDEEEQISAWEKELDALEEKAKEENKPFNRLFVTALVAQADMDPEEAVKEFYKVLGQEVVVEDNQDQSKDNGLPNVLGGSGSGSGSPDGTVNFGTMSKDDVNATVEQLLKQASEG